MSIHVLFQRFSRYHGVEVAIYVALVTGLLLTALLAVVDIGDKYSALNDFSERIAHSRAGSASLPTAGALTGAAPDGSPFLQGRTITIAGASLLQRVTDAISQAGGTVLSSEIEQKRKLSDDRSITVTANCELEQRALQRVLYDLEAGMPFLFVDQLIVEAPSAEGGRMQVRLGVSGLWLEERG